MSVKRIVLAITGITGFSAVVGVIRIQEIRHNVGEVTALFEGCTGLNNCVQRAFEFNTITVVGIVGLMLFGVVGVFQHLFGRENKSKAGPNISLPKRADAAFEEPNKEGTPSQRVSISIDVDSYGEVSTHVEITRFHTAESATAELLRLPGDRHPEPD